MKHENLFENYCPSCIYRSVVCADTIGITERQSDAGRSRLGEGL